MRATDLPDLNAKIEPKEQARMRREVIVHTLNAQGAWLDGVMRKLMPRDLYRMAHDKTGTPEQIARRQLTVKQWADRNDIRIIQQGMTQRIYKGTELLSTFGIKLAEK